MDSTGHPELFENLTADRGPTVRHRASNMVCRFAPQSRTNSIHIYNAAPGAEDISCQTSIEGISLTHYATQYSPTPSAEGVTRSAIEAIRQRWPDLRPYDGETANANVEGADFPPRYVSRGVVTQEDDNEYMTKVSVAQVDVWIVKQRMTVPLPRAVRGDLWSETLMIRSMIDVIVGPTEAQDSAQ